MGRRKKDPMICPNCGGTKPAETLGQRAWCGCDPKAPFQMTRKSISDLVDSIIGPDPVAAQKNAGVG